MICLKARDALIVSCHRDAAAVGVRTVGSPLRGVLRRRGASAEPVRIQRFYLGEWVHIERFTDLTDHLD